MTVPGSHDQHRIRSWWHEYRPVFWIHGRWEWGWQGNGWNRLALGKVAVYFGSGASPLARIRGWLSGGSS